MNFKLGEKYIVDVTENGIIPLMEFDRDRWFDKDCDNLDFLTDEEKIVVVNDVLDKIRAEIENDWQLKKYPSSPFSCGLRHAIEIIDKYKAESEPQDSEE